MKRLVLKVIAILFWLSAPVWLDAQTKGLEPVKIGYSGIGVTHDLLKIMTKNRIFEKHGLSAQTIYIGSGSMINQATVAGSIDFITSDLPGPIQAAVSGVDFKVISIWVNRLQDAIMTRKEIRRPQDLKDKKLAVSRYGSVSDVVTQMVLRHWKLEPHRDVALVQVGNTPTRIAAILSGQVDGGLISFTDIDRLQNSGCCVVLGDLSKLGIAYARFWAVATRGLLEVRPDMAQRLIQAFVEGTFHYKRHPDEAMAVLQSRGVDPKVARKVYQQVADSFRARPDPDLASIQGVLDTLPDERAKKVRPEGLIDPTPWNRLVQSGYLDRLYKEKGGS